jgi:hypothetical protein
MSAHLEFPRPIDFGDDYWLCRCEGFRLDAPSGRLGVIAEVRFASRLDRPDELVVRSGLFGNRVTIVPVSEVAEVLPRQGRIVLRNSPERRRHARVARLRSYLASAHGGGR